ncbi:hypothetical protein CSUI_003246 [Cystoisospora suis]|uniref:CCDC43 PWI-like domain-containing protein n=1 Tax=Cystoisospora suis TaxID=483139 RepID=A0A2C6L5W5_9APIC|nr:hypothetical protein CSUI_003246 [Cystoisospora suis]
MYAGSAEFEEFLCEHLEKIKVDTDVFKEYVLGILQDESMSSSEKVEAVTDSLQIAVEDESLASLVPDLASQFVEKWVKEVEEVQKQIKLQEQEAALKDAVKASTPGSSTTTAASSRASAWDAAQDTAVKQRLLDQFAWQVDEVVDFDENGADMIRNSSKKETQSGPIADDMFRNDNRARVAAAHQMDRLRAKAQHEDEMRRRAEQKKQEALKKEKEKQRVAKKERRAGR